MRKPAVKADAIAMLQLDLEALRASLEREAQTRSEILNALDTRLRWVENWISKAAEKINRHSDQIANLQTDLVALPRAIQSDAGLLKRHADTLWSRARKLEKIDPDRADRLFDMAKILYGEVEDMEGT